VEAGRQRRRIWLAAAGVAATLLASVTIAHREPLLRICREEWYLHRLRHGDAEAQRQAAAALGDLAVVRAIPPLLALTGMERDVVSEARIFDKDLGWQARADGPLHFKLGTQNPYYQGLVSILWRAVRRSLPPLVEAVRAGDWKARCIAMSLLGTLRPDELPEDAVAAMREAAIDADERVAVVAKDVLAAKGLVSQEP